MSHRDGVVLPTTRFDDLLPFRIASLADCVREPLHRYCAARHGIGLAEWRTLAILGERGTSTARDIGRAGMMHKTKVSRALNALEQSGLVLRRINDVDLRESLVTLTEAGAALNGELNAAAADYGTRFGEKLDAGERAAFGDMLDRLLRHSQAMVREWRAPAEQRH